MQKPVEVTIMGQKFVVRSDSTEEYVKEVAAFVDGRMSEILKKTKSISNLNVAILAAMNIADEFYKFRDKKDESCQLVAKKIEEVVELIDLNV